MRNICSVIALYNTINADKDFTKWFEFFTYIFNKLNVSPNYIAVSGKGYPKGIVRSTKIEKKLLEKKFADIENIGLFVVPKQSEAPFYDWTAYFTFISNKFTGDELILCVDDEIVSVMDKGIRDIMIECNKIGSFTYGVGFKREFKKGPEFYALGAIQGIERDSSEAEMIANWNRDRMTDNKIQHGYMRDIYPLNILNSTHLENIVDGIKLKDWIEADKANGKILNIEKNMYLWIIENNQICRIRSKLSNFLICYNADVLPSLL